MTPEAERREPVGEVFYRDGRAHVADSITKIYYHIATLGDHGDAWIVVYHNDVEVTRINQRFVESFDWKITTTRPA